MELDRETGRALAVLRWYDLEQFGRTIFEVRWFKAGEKLRRVRVPYSTVELGRAIEQALGPGRRATAIEYPATGRGKTFNFNTTRSLLVRCGALAATLELTGIVQGDIEWIEPFAWRSEVLGIRNRWMPRDRCKEAALTGGHGAPDGGVRAIVPGLRELVAEIGGDIDVVEAAGVAECLRRMRTKSA